MSHIVIDPVTRVDGHLRVEAEVSGGAVSDAWVSGTMFRGIESILRGRDARDAWLLAQRVCGACTGVHALASVRAVENALGIVIPRNARLVRNLLLASTFVQEHVLQFYLREAPDYVDPVAAMSADPAATSAYARSLSDWPNSSPEHFLGIRDMLPALTDHGPFANGYLRHPALHLPAELSLLLLAHYFEALDWQRGLVRFRTMLGGKSPHPQTFLMGGMALAPAWGGPSRPATGEHPWGATPRRPAPLSSEGLAELSSLLADAAPFVSSLLVTDSLAIGAYYPESAQIGRAAGHYLSFGEFPLADTQPAPLYLSRGRIMDRDLSAVRPVDQVGVAEVVSHSWYENPLGDDTLAHPTEAAARPEYAGPTPPFTTLQGYDKYSWVKAPRYDDDPMETGPLARLLATYPIGAADVHAALDQASNKLNLGPDWLFGNLGRTIARAIEAELLTARLGEWLRELVANLASGDVALADLSHWDPGTWPSESVGVGLAEGPRGAVGHWVSIRDGRIADYQIVDGSTWNASPRDQRGRRGACEQALIGTPVADEGRPLEILRTVHSFDICPNCAVH